MSTTKEHKRDLFTGLEKIPTSSSYEGYMRIEKWSAKTGASYDGALYRALRGELTLSIYLDEWSGHGHKGEGIYNISNNLIEGILSGKLLAYRHPTIIFCTKDHLDSRLDCCRSKLNKNVVYLVLCVCTDKWYLVAEDKKGNVLQEGISSMRGNAAQGSMLSCLKRIINPDLTKLPFLYLSRLMDYEDVGLTFDDSMNMYKFFHRYLERNIKGNDFFYLNHDNCLLTRGKPMVESPCYRLNSIVLNNPRFKSCLAAEIRELLVKSNPGESNEDS